MITVHTQPYDGYAVTTYTVNDGIAGVTLIHPNPPLHDQPFGNTAHAPLAVVYTTGTIRDHNDLRDLASAINTAADDLARHNGIAPASAIERVIAQMQAERLANRRAAADRAAKEDQ